VRQIDGVLDLGWVREELTAYYSHTGRPSIDPVTRRPSEYRVANGACRLMKAREMPLV
jgi:hypothetical protein